MSEEFKTWWDSSLHAASFKQHLPYPPTASTMAWAYGAWCAGQTVEREACARVCDEVFEESNNYRTQGYASHCAAAIRARGNDA